MTKVKNWRRRGEDDEDGDDLTNPASTEKEVKSSSRKKEKAKPVVKPSGSKLLSFVGDEEEGDGGENLVLTSTAKKEKIKERVQLKQGGVGVFRFGEDGANGEMVLLQSQKKKFGYGAGQRVESGKEKGANAGTIPSNTQAQAGEYTKEKLLELQRNTKSLGAAKPVVESKPSEPVVVLKGLVKPVVTFKDSPTEGMKRMAIGRITEAEDQAVGRETLARGDDAERRLGLMGIGNGADSGGITHIPDAAVIAAAKARRNRLRQAQAAPDYIALNEGDGKGMARESGDNEGEKGVVESSEDEAEVHGRMSFLGETVSGKLKHKGAVFEVLRDHQEEDEADGERTWEEEQLRKGFGKRVDEAAHRIVPGSAVPSVQGAFSTSLPGMAVGNGGWAFGRGGMEALSVSQQSESAWQTLNENVQRLRVQAFLCSL